METSSTSIKRNSWKARRMRRQKKLKREKEEVAQKADKNEENESRESGSVLVDKVFEPLNAMLEAYEARLKTDQTLDERWNTYPRDP